LKRRFQVSRVESVKEGFSGSVAPEDPFLSRHCSLRLVTDLIIIILMKVTKMNKELVLMINERKTKSILIQKQLWDWIKNGWHKTPDFFREIEIDFDSSCKLLRNSCNSLDSQTKRNEIDDNKSKIKVKLIITDEEFCKKECKNQV